MTALKLAAELAVHVITVAAGILTAAFMFGWVHP
jgi:hypothetical protein